MQIVIYHIYHANILNPMVKLEIREFGVNFKYPKMSSQYPTNFLFFLCLARIACLTLPFFIVGFCVVIDIIILFLNTMHIQIIDKRSGKWQCIIIFDSNRIRQNFCSSLDLELWITLEFIQWNFKGESFCVLVCLMTFWSSFVVEKFSPSFYY